MSALHLIFIVLCRFKGNLRQPRFTKKRKSEKTKLVFIVCIQCSVKMSSSSFMYLMQAYSPGIEHVGRDDGRNFTLH
jgi:hypothetical protein